MILSWLQITRKLLTWTWKRDTSKGLLKRTQPPQYLPHHPDVNPKKPGNVRRVCAAGAKFQGSSLNSHLLRGPDLLKNLVGTFMRFREEKVALSGDIEAMFNQVVVPNADQVALRFLRRELSSPACSTSSLHKLHIFTACFKGGAPLAVQFAVKARAVQTKKLSWSDGYNDYLLQRGNGNFEDSEDSEDFQSSQETDSSQEVTEHLNPWSCILDEAQEHH